MVVARQIMILLDEFEQAYQLLAVGESARAFQFGQQFIDGNRLLANRDTIEDTQYG